MPVTKQQTRRLMALFRGHATISGTHGVPEKVPGGLKWIIKSTARTLRAAPNEHLWTQHLSGARPLGVIPIAEDSSCRWGSIDVDEYDVDLLEIIRKAESLGLPLVPVRSKSGGLHLFAFLREAESAAAAQTTLREVAAALGVAKSEIFPKQTRMLADRNDAGSWMIVPYFGESGEVSDGTYDGKLQRQVGIKPKGAEMTLGEFLDLAESRLSTTEDISSRIEKAVTPTAEKSKRGRARGKSLCDFSDGPPCMQCLMGNGSVVSDGRKVLLFNMSTYYKRADPDGWQERVESANHKFSPPLPTSEVDGIIKSTAKKTYEYQCKEEPLASYCNSGLCRARKFGVGQGEKYPVIANLRVRDDDPPTWIVEMEDHPGKIIKVNTETLMHYSRFHVAMAAQIHATYGRQIKHEIWLTQVSEAMENMGTPLPAAPGVGRFVEFFEQLENFLTNKAKGERREDVAQGRPWEDAENGVYIFTLEALMAHMERRGVKLNQDSRKECSDMLKKKLSATHKRLNLGNKYSRNCYLVPISSVTSPPVDDPPEIEGSDV